MVYMRSKYLIEVFHDGKNLLFNGLNGAMLELDSPSAALVKDSAGLEQIAQENPSLHEVLVQTKCILTRAEEELERISFRNNRAIYGDTKYELTINPTMNCNFKCWYCYESHVKGKMTLETQDAIVVHVENLIKKGEITALNLGWFGGEPLMTFTSVIYPLSKRLKELCEFYAMPFQNSITTNAFLLHEKYSEQYDEIQLYFYQITLDGNRDRHNKVRFLKANNRDTFDKITENIRMLLATVPNAHVNLRINFEDQTLVHIEEIIDEFPTDVRTRIHVDFQRVWQTCSEDTPANDRLKEIFDKFTAQGYVTFSASNELVLFRGKKCYADKWYQAVVNFDGNVYKCTARDFNHANREGYLRNDGEIAWDTGRLERRFKRMPWERERCLDCSLLPLCMGPCSQMMVERGEENRNHGCFLDTMELTVEDYVISRYEDVKRTALAMAV